MTVDQFDKIVEQIFTDCKYNLVNKGREYQNTNKEGSNVFANFETAGENAGLDRKDILYVYLFKHIASISRYIKDCRVNGVNPTNKRLTEPITGRIVDAINYLLLLYVMCEDEKAPEQTCNGLLTDREIHNKAVRENKNL